MKMSNTVGATLVVGGGIAGIQASLDLADAGFKVYLLDESPSIGGTMAQLDKTFPTNDCSMCILAPKLVGAGRHPNIELMTYAKLEHVEGEAGNFKVRITKKPRFVDVTKCTGCGVCAQHCPVEMPNEYDEKLGVRKAIFVPFPQAVPLKYAIDEENCLKCGLCKQVCKADAVDYDQKPETVELNVGAIILSPGFAEFDPQVKSMYGYGRLPNVVTSIEFERILSASGPNGGRILRPSDGTIPKKIAFIQCVGSRDINKYEYCSGFCCMYTLKHAVMLKEKYKDDIKIHVFYTDMRSNFKGYEEFYEESPGDGGQLQ
jgi:heterodisulfide reductase subunit A